jgi:prepilin-type N-terminal cleavage/methylation domain-containing protein
MRNGRRRRGYSLLELLVAMTLLGTAGGAWIALLAQTRATMHATQAAELRVRAASALLAGVARESRTALMEKAGRRRIGALELRISLASATLVAIDVADPATGSVIVGTLVHRPPEVANAR